MMTLVRKILSHVRYRLVHFLFWFIPVRWQHIIWTWRSKQPLEIEINLFSLLDGIDGSVLDLGGNFGQFALSLFKVNQSLQVESWEPNKAQRWSLHLIKCLYVRRFTYRLIGAGEKQETKTLLVPITRNNDLSPNASLDAGEFDKGYVQTRLSSDSKNGEYGFKETSVAIHAVDEFELAPLVIKVDVEGWELQALEGARETLKRCYPLLMIENNNMERWRDFLDGLGYVLYSYHHKEQRLQVVEKYSKSLNIIALHTKTEVAVLERLQPLIKT